jgi:gluconate 2-dehydrogenase gamma chain
MIDLDSRRNFLKFGFLSSAVFLMNGCEFFGITTPMQTIKVLQNDLFPKAKELGIDTPSYMHIVFNHPRISDADKEFIKNGVKWLNEESIEMYHTAYIDVSAHKRQKVLASIAQTEWGDSFIYSMMNYIFEATFCDPIYGGNNNENGWKWLEFSGGLPRPTKAYV